MSTLTVEDLARRLTLTANEAPVDALLNSLSPESAHYFRLCCIPHVFDERILRIMDPSLTEAEAREQCGELTTMPPVGMRDDAFAVNDAARKLVFGQWFQAEKLPEFRDVSERLAEHYLAAASGEEGDRSEAKKHRVFHLLGQSIDAGFAEFVRLFAAALERCDLATCEQLVRLVHEYDAILPPLLALELRYHEASLAVEMREDGQAERMLGALQKERSLPPLLKARVLHRFGKISADRGEWSKAEGQYRDALAGGHAKGAFECRLHHDLGVARREQGDSVLAEQEISRARELAIAARDERFAAVCNESLATLRQGAQRGAEAIDLFEQTIAILKRFDDRFSLARVFDNLAAAHIAAGNLAEARGCLFEGLQAARDAKAARAEGRLLVTLARVHQGLGDRSAALQVATEGCDVFVRLQDPLAAGLAKRQQAAILRAEGQTAAAENAYRESISWLEQVAPEEAAATRAELTNARPLRWDLPWYGWGALMVLALAVVTLMVIVAIVRAR